VSGLVSLGASVTLNGAEPEQWLSIADLWRPRINRLLPFSTRPAVRSFSRWTACQQGRRWAVKLLQNCDVAHFVGTGWDLAGFPLARAAKMLGKPITCLPAVHPGTWGDAPLDTDLYRQMDSIFCLSDYEAAQLIRPGMPREKFVRCGCSPSSQPTGDGERFRDHHRLHGKSIVAFVGRKSRGKGYHSLRKSIDALHAEGREVVLVSIGRDVEGPYPPLSAEIDIDLGAADEATKQDALAACDIFALPSEAESFGIVYVEAWAYGKPVICGTAPASRELVTRHGGGIVSDGSVTGIRTAIQELLDSPDRGRAMGQAGREAVAAEYTPEKVVERHLQTWNELLKDRT
jgi:glycosyltransferase involved in cell wall biosynthesis